MPDKEDEYCPVLWLHELWNYEQCADGEPGETKKMALDMLIDRGTTGLTNTCRMFVERR